MITYSGTPSTLKKKKALLEYAFPGRRVELNGNAQITAIVVWAHSLEEAQDIFNYAYPELAY